MKMQINNRNPSNYQRKLQNAQKFWFQGNFGRQN